MAKRPHMNSTGPQLQTLFEAHKADSKVLRELLAELKHRTTPSARALRQKVEDALSGKTASSAGASTGASKWASAPPPPPPSPPPPAHHTLNCRACKKALRVPVSPERTAYSCPQCKAEFEVSYANGLIQVVWVEAKESPEDSPASMTDALAREILEVAADADFAAIKAAWRRLAQLYHPDKHTGTAERLRKAAELEMKRINEAYRYLEASTASDF